MPHHIHGVIEDWQVDGLRDMTPGERVQMGIGLIELGFALSEAGRQHRARARSEDPVAMEG